MPVYRLHDTKSPLLLLISAGCNTGVLTVGSAAFQGHHDDADSEQLVAYVTAALATLAMEQVAAQ